MGYTVGGVSKNLFDSYGYYCFDDGLAYRKQYTEPAAILIRQIKRKQ